MKTPLAQVFVRNSRSKFLRVPTLLVEPSDLAMIAGDSGCLQDLNVDDHETVRSG